LPLATADGRSLANDVRAGADTSAPDGVGRAAAQRARSSPTGTESPGIDIDLVALAYVSCNVGVDRHRVHQLAMIAACHYHTELQCVTVRVAAEIAFATACPNSLPPAPRLRLHVFRQYRAKCFPAGGLGLG
jgi:hypothetical protein